MKTEMRIKTQERLRFGEAAGTIYPQKGKTVENRHQRGLRAAACAALLVLLGVSGYVGSGEGNAQVTAAPVAKITTIEDDASMMTFEEIRLRHDEDRAREIELLDSVIDHPDTKEEQRNAALEQKVLLAGRMEEEAQIRAALAHMGLGEAAVLCGAKQVTVILPQQGEQTQTVRVIDAVTGIADVQAQDVKIILAKK